MDLDSTQFLYGVIAGMLPSLLWLWFWLKENHLHPEPRNSIAAVFFFGMVAVILALPLQWFVSKIFADTFTLYSVWAYIEEVLKFGAVYLVIIHQKKMDEPIDAMIYMLTAALGFAALENIFFMLGAIKGCGIVSTIIFGNLRFLGATLLHIISSSAVGFSMALVFYHKKWVRFLAVILGLVAAGALHLAFNLAIISGKVLDGCPTLINSDSSDILRTFGWVWAGVILLVILFEEIKAVKPPRKKETGELK